MQEGANSAPELPTEVVAALHRRHKLEAIKLLRAAKNTGLKEAKDEIERFLAANPQLQRRNPSAADGRGRNVLLLIIAIGLILALYHTLTQ